MVLTPGTRFGPYEVTALIGEGGMGQVYRATDTNLKRPVALKVLPEALATDAERLARFQREAEVLARLNHPNIAQIHGLEKSEGRTALVMELVEGPNFADRIAQGAVPLDEALPIARQMADALEAAHEQGIIHRDLKPANVKLRPDGLVKVLDFGLAKAIDPTGASSPGGSMSPTITSPAMTQAGTILGTAAYMSPEQARGRTVDKRADIWAFGVLLFEMLTGARLFRGGEVSDTLALVLTQEPDWSVLPASTPAPIRTLLRRCLQKDRTKRLADMADARLEIDEALAVPPEIAMAVAALPQQPAWRRALPWLVASAGLVSAALAVVLWAPWRAAPVAPTVRMSADSGATSIAIRGPDGAVALSPDGSTLAFIARSPADSVPAPQRLFVRRLDELEARALAGTDGAAAPFFSPDGQWIAFFAGGSLMKIAARGGAVVTLCDAPMPRGGWWGEDDTILFASLDLLTAGGAVMRVSAAGGQPEQVTTRTHDEFGHTWPQVLPGGRGILYTVAKEYSSYNDATIMVQPLPAGERKVLHRGGFFARYLPSGHLTFVREGTLLAAPFDLDSLQLTGQPAPMLKGLTVVPTVGSALASVSLSGTLVYLPSTGEEVGRAPVLWLDRSGTTRPLRAEASAWATPRFSPDGGRLALTINDGRQNDIWVYDWERDTLTRLTSDQADDMVPVWTPDGTRIAFASIRGGQVANLYWQRADGTGDAQRLTDSPTPQLPDSFHPGGRVLAFHEGNPLSGRQRLMILSVEGNANSGWRPGEPAELVGGPFIKAFPTFSADGRWLAYVSVESGQPQVYVQPFPGPGRRWQVTSGSGSMPMWSRTRRELLYATIGGEDPQIMVVPYSIAGDVFNAGRAERWSPGRFSTNPPIAAYGPGVDLHPDGERIAVAPIPSTDASSAESRLVFVFNFSNELRRLAPVD